MYNGTGGDPKYKTESGYVRGELRTNEGLGIMSIPFVDVCFLSIQV